MVFCFALVLVQQHQTNGRLAASKQSYARSHSNKLSTPSLKPMDTIAPIAVTQASSPTINKAASASANPNGNVTAPPQPSASSGSAVQGATQNNKPGGIIEGVSKGVKNILNNGH